MAETATDAIYRALRSPEPDPDLVHAAVEEIRGLSGQNVIATIGAKIDSQSARIDVKFSQIEAQISELRSENGEIRTEMKAGFAQVNTRIDALGSRFDTLQKVIWPLIGLLATTVFGLLYKVVTTG